MDGKVNSFRGEAPRMTPRELPPNGAQIAENCRLQSGDLESWRHFTLDKTLANAAQTIYKLNGAWLSWTAQVDVARGLIAGDTTFRTYLTSPGLYTTPRWTNYAMATTGAEPYPVTTRPLGVPAPTVTPTLATTGGGTPDIDVTDSGNELASWITSGTFSVGTTSSSVVEDAVVGTPTAPGYRHTFANNPGAPAFQYRDFGFADNQSLFFESKFKPFSNGSTLQAEFRFANTDGGAGAAVVIGYPAGPGGGLFISLGVASSWGTRPSSLEQLAIAALDGTGATIYTMRITGERQANGTTAVVAVLLSGVTVLATVDLTSRFDIGAFCGFTGVTDFTPAMATVYDDIHITGTGTYDDASTATGVAYVYTFVNDIGEESAPSTPSETVIRPDGATITITTATTYPDDPTYAVTTKRIYRAVTGTGTSTIYLLVAEIPLATATFDDNLDDSEIGPDVLESTDWDLPPANMQGILALPNNTMAGFFANQLCFSEFGRPHAWPVKYRLTANSDIVAIANIDNTIVIGTKAKLQTATGNDPATYSMSEPGEPQSCVSKRSMTYLDGVGVVFASPDGYQVCAGSAGSVRNATGGIFTKRQWKALLPSSIIAGVHDGVLHFFFTGSTPDRGYMLDAKPDGFGLVRTSYHANALFADVETDALYLLLDVFNEPTDALLPVPPSFTLPGGAVTRIYEFDSNESLPLTYRWRGRMNLLPYPATFHWARVRADDYVNLVAKFIGNGTTLDTQAQVSEDAYRLTTGVNTYNKYEVELIGTSRVQSVQFAEDIREIT